MHATLADVIADTAQNSIEAGAKHVSLTLVEDGTTIAVTIKDDGKGMDEATQARAFNPFYTEAGKHDKRKVGLGLPILKQLCESTDGAVSLTSQKGVGTELRYSFSATWATSPRQFSCSSTTQATSTLLSPTGKARRNIPSRVLNSQRPLAALSPSRAYPSHASSSSRRRKRCDFFRKLRFFCQMRQVENPNTLEL